MTTPLSHPSGSSSLAASVLSHPTECLDEDMCVLCKWVGTGVGNPSLDLVSVLYDRSLKCVSGLRSNFQCVPI
jgi:hypothetical protein